MIYRTDYHIHSTYSDGKSVPEDYPEAAIKAGIKEIGFSEHLNLVVPNQQWCMDPVLTKGYISNIKRLRKARKDIQIRTGLEIDFFPAKEDLIFDFISGLDLDYTIGSVHYLGDTTVDSSPDFFINKDIDDIWKSYFNLLFQAVESGLFDILGHPDLLRIYNHKPSFDPEYLYSELARKLSVHDMAFEINTNGRNRPLAGFYPDMQYLHLFKREDVPVCVNSDAHFPARVGQYFDEAYRFLKMAGYTEMCIFKNRERFMVPVDFSKS